MVDKISGNKPPQPTGSQGVDSSRGVQPGQVDALGKISQTSERGKIDRVRRATRPLTAEEREQLFHMIDEEASRLFGSVPGADGKRKTLRKAVKMVFDGGVIEDEKK